MIDYNSQFEVAHDLERRLAPRRAIEAAMRSGRWKHAHKDSLVLRDHITRPILRTALKIAGVYARGTRNALQLVVRHLRLEFQDLPESFTAFAYCVLQTCTSMASTVWPRSSWSVLRVCTPTCAS